MPGSAARSCWTSTTSTPTASTRSRSAARSAWSSSGRTRSRRCPSTRTSRPACGSTAMKKKDVLDDVVEKSLQRRQPLERGQGPARQAGLRPVRRAAAAAVHRPGDRGRAAGAADGRAVLGARPDLDAGDRGPDPPSSRTSYTIVIVTHNMQQAARVSDRTAFFTIAGAGKPGRLIEIGDTARCSAARPRRPPRTTSPAASANPRATRRAAPTPTKKVPVDHALLGILSVPAGQRHPPWR